MRKMIQTAVLTGLVLVLVTNQSFTCTSFAFIHKGYPIFGTNYDNNFAPGLIYVNKKGVQKSGWEQGTTGETAVWTSEYGSVTFTCVGYQLAWAGMNEAGLVLSTMALGETQSPAPDKRPPLASPLWMQYALDTCGTIEEVFDIDKQVRIQDTVDHYLVCDRTGNCAAIEFLDGKMVVHTQDTMPVNALANAPYSSCAEYWKRKGPLPKSSYDSRHRVGRAGRMMASFAGKSNKDAVDFAFKILSDVSPSNRETTRWSIVFDTGNNKIYYRSYANQKIRRIDLNRFDFSCGTPVKMLPVHNGFSGDVTDKFKDYSHERSLAFLVNAVKYHRPDFPEEQIAPLLQKIESFPCVKK